MYKELDLKQLKEMQDKAYNHGYDTRLKAADDMLFAWVTQWDDQYLNQSDLQYRGEFNICRKAMRHILTDLILNQVQVDFDPIDGTDETAADIMDGMYRGDVRNNTAQEAIQNSNQEAVTCGVGAWEWRNEWRTDRAGDDAQVLRRVPIYEANNNVFWDPNAKLKDKSDARYVSVLVSYTECGYEELKEEFDFEPETCGGTSFANPEESYSFPWTSEDKRINVVRFYHRVKQKVKHYTFVDMFGTERVITEFDIDEHEDELVDQGYNVDETRTKEINRYVVYRYIASGDGILDVTVIPGEHIPVVPQYGERAFVEGEETYEGIIRLAKDPQRLRNFQLSYLADIVSRSPREKPIFTAEQIGGFQDMYEVSGPDNQYPYLMQNGFFEGQALPTGPVGYIKAPDVPQALMASMAESRVAVDDVAGAGLPADIMDTDLSGKAVQSLQKRLDMQSYTYQDNHKHAMRRDGEIYASMARDVHTGEQEVTLVRQDGSKSRETINKLDLDYHTMGHRVKNDISNAVFDVYADIGPSFESVKEQNKAELKELINGMQPGSPQYNMLLNEYLMLVDGSGFKDIREYARKELIMMGIKEPETEEDKAMLKQAQEAKANQPDPLMLEGQARMLEGQAAMMNEQNDANKIIVDQFNAETNRQKVQIQAAEAGVKIKDIEVGTYGKQLDNVLKLRGAVTG